VRTCATALLPRPPRRPRASFRRFLQIRQVLTSSRKPVPAHLPHPSRGAAPARQSVSIRPPPPAQHHDPRVSGPFALEGDLALGVQAIAVMRHPGHAPTAGPRRETIPAPAPARLDHLKQVIVMEPETPAAARNATAQDQTPHKAEEPPCI